MTVYIECSNKERYRLVDEEAKSFLANLRTQKQINDEWVLVDKGDQSGQYLFQKSSIVMIEISNGETFDLSI